MEFKKKSQNIPEEMQPYKYFRIWKSLNKLQNINPQMPNEFEFEKA